MHIEITTHETYVRVQVAGATYAEWITVIDQLPKYVAREFYRTTGGMNVDIEPTAVNGGVNEAGLRRIAAVRRAAVKLGLSVVG